MVIIVTPVFFVPDLRREEGVLPGDPRARRASARPLGATALAAPPLSADARPPGRRDATEGRGSRPERARPVAAHGDRYRRTCARTPWGSHVPARRCAPCSSRHAPDRQLSVAVNAWCGL